MMKQIPARDFVQSTSRASRSAPIPGKPRLSLPERLTAAPLDARRGRAASAAEPELAACGGPFAAHGRKAMEDEDGDGDNGGATST